MKVNRIIIPLFLLALLTPLKGENRSFRISVNTDNVKNRISPLMTGSCLEDVNHEVYGGIYDQRIYGENFEEPASENNVSAQWRPDVTGTAEAGFSWLTEGAYNSKACQQFEKKAGNGRVGISNGGLNGWGIPVFEGLSMKGQIMLKSFGRGCCVYVALESSDGSTIYARKALNGVKNEWKKFSFELHPNATDPEARFSVYIEKRGSVAADMAILFENGSRQAEGTLSRKDIVEAFRDQGTAILRYGGTMVNSPEYIFKNSIGPREDRPAYSQYWNKYASNGFGIEDFLQLCEAIGCKSSFAISMSEKPEDVADMISYLTLPDDTEWGAKRAAAGHPAPYTIDYLGMGNEECLFTTPKNLIVSFSYDEYIERFNALYDAVHSVNPQIRIVHSAWWRRDEKDTMERVFRTLDGKADFWDYHPGVDKINIAEKANKDLSLMEAYIKEWNPDSNMKAIVLEENGDTHHLRRALCHAAFQNEVRRHGDFVEACCAANALQPYRQHDTHWDQGIIFFTPDKVWGQPPYYAARMTAEAYQPLNVECTCDGPLDVCAAVSEDGKELCIYVVNLQEEHAVVDFNLGGFVPEGEIKVNVLHGDDLTGDNPYENMDGISTKTRSISASDLNGFSIPAWSFTTLQLKK